VAFHEDRDMITAQARNIALDPHTPMVPLAMDSALTQFRRLIAQAVDAERAYADERLPADSMPDARSRPGSADNVRGPAAK
jgi:vanillate O-demethylase monooxygenase subunit